MQDKKLGFWDIDLSRKLGKGGFSFVYRCRAPGSKDYDAAIKIYNKRSSVNTYEREVGNLKIVSTAEFTPNLLDYGRDEEGSLCIVTQRVVGRTLGSYVRRRGSLSANRTRKLIRCVLQVLKWAHSEGVVHLDLQPSNILVSGDSFHVIDWGVGRKMGQGRLGHVQANRTVAAPELSYGDYSEASDFYCLGWLIYFALTGRKPFHRHVIDDKDYSQLAHCFEQPDIPDELPRSLRPLILNWIQKKPEQRKTGYSLSKLLEEGEPLLWDFSASEDFEEIRDCDSFLRSAATRGVPLCQYRLAITLIDDGELEEARFWLRHASSQGIARASTRLALLIMEQGDPGDREEAYGLFRRAATGGHDYGQYQLAKHILLGHCAGDRDEAEGLLRAAAENGERNAQFLLARKILTAEQDQQEREMYLRKAAERGHVGASKALEDITSMPT
jgi:serine/threonine protein kinase